MRGKVKTRGFLTQKEQFRLLSGSSPAVGPVRQYQPFGSLIICASHMPDLILFFVYSVTRVYETKATPRAIEASIKLDLWLISNRSGLNQGGEGKEEMQFEKKVASGSSREDP
jgi:hypothetical protein